jgi:transposase
MSSISRPENYAMPECVRSAPRNDPICFRSYLYRARNRVERFFNRTKQCRRVATRYDRLAANYLAFVQLAS